jgi:hypothetical protein
MRDGSAREAGIMVVKGQKMTRCCKRISSITTFFFRYRESNPGLIGAILTTELLKAMYDSHYTIADRY